METFMTDINTSQKDDNVDVNLLLDVVYDHCVSQATGGRYYKANAMTGARRAVEAYEYLLEAKKILALPFVQKIEFEMEQEYNDEGGTYLTVAVNMNYLNSEGELGDVRFYSGCESIDEAEDEEFEEIAIQANAKEMIEHFLGSVNDLDEDMVQSTNFFDSVWTKDTIIGLYQENFPQAYSAIDKHFIAQAVEGKGVGVRAPHKIWFARFWMTKVYGEKVGRVLTLNIILWF